ncbi:MAG: PQQ-binding-like beta-propeller repeat protein [Planctomycetaceae bacterium]|nr:PQQ-binding-like beta-propeller repeat protein [Planctomycetaceae bacterium]
MPRLVLLLPLLCLSAAVALAGEGERAIPGTRVENTGATRNSPGPISVSPLDWPWWRGPQRNGMAYSEQKPPVRWSETENVIWSSPVPGRGHGTVIVVGDQLFLATADEQAETQSVLCYDRETGKQLWKTQIFEGGLTKKGNAKSTQASGSLACDGTRLFVNFLNRDAVHTTALDLEGRQLWQTKITDYVVHQGFGSSPALYGPLVLVSADNKGGGVVAGLNRKTGQIVWKNDRPSTPNYPSPIVLPIGGRDQLLMTGCNLVSSFAPLTGEKLWETEGATTECVTSTVTDGRLIFTSGGYPKNHISAVVADGSGKVEWENKTRVYVPSMFVREGHLYGVTDAGVACCWKAATGEELWKERLGGTFSASPVPVGDVVYATNEAGRTYVFRATPAGAEKLAENTLGDETIATPVICGSRIYMRVAAQQDGKRQETLYCLGSR